MALRRMEYGFTAISGKTWHNDQVDQYNEIQERIESWMAERGITDRNEAPETMLYESHQAFCLFSGILTTLE